MEYKIIFRENGEMDQMVVEAESKLDAIFVAKKNNVVTAYEIETEMDRDYLRFDKVNTIDFSPVDRKKLYSDIYIDKNGRHVSKRLIEGTLYFDLMLRIYDENGNYIADGIEVI